MQYAIIQTGGKQYKVSPGSELEVEKLDLKPGATTQFTEVLLIAGEDNPKLGFPTISKAHVEACVLAQTRGVKVRSATYKAKSKYRKVKGHRQSLTRVKITRIVGENAAKRNPSVALAKGESDKKSKPQAEAVKKVTKVAKAAKSSQTKKAVKNK